MRAFGRFGRRVAPAGTWRRRGIFTIGALAVLAVMGFSVATALGSGTTTIQDNNALELDGNAVAGNGASASPAVPSSHDWNNVYCSAISTASNCSGVSADGASARSFQTDPFNNGTADDIYTGGGSKDGLPISGWLWKKGAPQAKDDLEHAYAAEYKSGQVCGDAALTLNCANHQLLFFGADRYSNSGNSDIGFWFLKDNVTESSVAGSGGFKFTGNHTDGDVLVLSTFQNGGVVPQVAVYKWSCPTALSGPACDSTGTLTLDSSSTGADCVNGVDTHGNALPAIFGDYCATVNTGSVPSPWRFTEKSSDGSYVAANTFGPGTFFEGGLDMTNLGLANDCFSSFVSETRSSQSTTATLSDLVVGKFAVCSASISTTRSAAAVSPGTSVTDTATVTGSGLLTPPYPTGSVSFGICGPSSTSISSCSGLTTTSAGTGTLSPDTSQGAPPGQSTATSSPAFNTAAAPAAPGYYCFTASWGGDSNYTGTITDNGSVGTECFQVQQIPTMTVTTPSDSSGTALTGPVDFDSTVKDNAVVTASNAGGGYPTGSVSFYVCDPGHTTADAMGNPTCAAGAGVAVLGNPQTLTQVGTATTQSSALSGGVKANMAGVWCFRATYTPDTTTFVTSSDNTTDECFTVNQAPTTTVSTPHDDTNSATQSFALSATGINVKDNVTVNGVTDGGNPTGTLKFWLCGPGQATVVTVTMGVPSCAPDTTTAAAVDGTPTLVPVVNSTTASSASSSDITLTQVGQYCFYAKFIPSGSNGNYLGSSDGSSEECFTVIDSTSTTSSQRWVPNDAATVSSTGNSTTIAGTLTFTLYPDGDCNASESVGSPGDAPLFEQTFALNAVTPQTRSTDTSKPVGTGQTINGNTGDTLVAFSSPLVSSASWSWSVIFTSGDSNVASSSRCEATAVTINDSQAHTP